MTHAYHETSFPRIAGRALLLGMLVLAAPLGAQQQATVGPFEPCGNSTRVVECARITVRERPVDTTSRALALRVVRIRQDSTRAATMATFVLAGGPGGAAPEMARGDISTFVAWAEHGDVVFMDQRGSEDGSPLRCVLSATFDPFTGIFPGEELSRCREEAARTSDLTAYGTEEAAEDLERARVALGYGQLNLVGSSYGTRLALEYIERYPTRVRAAMLDGVVPRELRAPLYYAADVDASIVKLAEVCRGDGRCRPFGDPVAHFRAIMARLAAAPATVTVRTGPATEMQVTVGPEDFAYSVRGLLSGDGNGQLPSRLALADSTGDVTAFAGQYARRAAALARLTSMGLHLAVLCAEDVAAITPRAASEATAKTITGSYIVDQYQAACARWRVPRVQAPAAAARLTTPLLLLSGALDPITPPRWGEVVRKRSTNVRHVIFPYGGHSYPGTGMASCKTQIVREFLRTARPDALDTTCVTGATPPRFGPPT